MSIEELKNRESKSRNMRNTIMKKLHTSDKSAGSALTSQPKELVYKPVVMELYTNQLNSQDKFVNASATSTIIQKQK